MNCQYCRGNTRVINTTSRPNGVYRIRECLECKQQFTTAELPNDEAVTMEAIRERYKRYNMLKRKR